MRESKLAADVYIVIVARGNKSESLREARSADDVDSDCRPFKIIH